MDIHGRRKRYIWWCSTAGGPLGGRASTVGSTTNDAIWTTTDVATIWVSATTDVATIWVSAA